MGTLCLGKERQTSKAVDLLVNTNHNSLICLLLACLSQVCLLKYDPGVIKNFSIPLLSIASGEVPRKLLPFLLPLEAMASWSRSFLEQAALFAELPRLTPT